MYACVATHPRKFQDLWTWADDLMWQRLLNILSDDSDPNFHEAGRTQE